MEIHKPKPWHGVREFLKEYVIIVVGVLTALGAEQAVETMREHRAAAEARDAVRAEIAADLGWMIRRREEQGCIDRRLDELSAVLAAAREGKPYVAPQWVGRLLIVPLSSRRWTAASQAGRVTLFADKEQAAYGQIYFSLENFADRQEKEQVSWATLRTMEGARSMSPAMVWGLSEALAQARLDNYLQKRGTTRTLTAAQALGIRASEAARSRDDVRRYPSCIPIDTDHATAVALIGNPTGEP